MPRTLTLLVSQVYTNDRGVFRQITGAGPNYRLYAGQMDVDTLEYRAWRTPRRATGPRIQQFDVPVGRMDSPRDAFHAHITRRAFLAWQIREATPEEVQALPSLEPIHRVPDLSPDRPDAWRVHAKIGTRTYSVLAGTLGATLLLQAANVSVSAKDRERFLALIKKDRAFDLKKEA